AVAENQDGAFRSGVAFLGQRRPRIVMVDASRLLRPRLKRPEEVSEPAAIAAWRRPRPSAEIKELGGSRCRDAKCNHDRQRDQRAGSDQQLEDGPLSQHALCERYRNEIRPQPGGPSGWSP